MSGEGALREVQKETYNERLDRMGYFCSICGHEANGPEGLRVYEPAGEGPTLNICRSRCLE